MNKENKTIINQEAYEKYMQYMNSDVLNADTRLIQTSDEDILVDPLSFLNTIRKTIEYLPSEEQEEILNKVKSVKIIWYKAEEYKAKAYGLVNMKNSYSFAKEVMKVKSSEVLEYFGQMKTMKEVLKIVRLDWGYDLSERTLKRFYYKNIEVIKDKQELYKRDYNSVKLAHKISRLEELVDIYKVRKDTYDRTKDRKDESQLLKIIQQIRKESEVDVLRIEGTIEEKRKITVHDHINEEVLDGLTINEIIIARAAAKIGVDSSYLLNKLNHSFYSKFSGFTSNRGVENNDTPIYPSEMEYDWDKIRAKNKAITQADDRLKKVSEIKDQDLVNEQNLLKQIMIEKLEKRKEQLSNAEERVKKNTKSKY